MSSSPAAGAPAQGIGLDRGGAGTIEGVIARKETDDRRRSQPRPGDGRRGGHRPLPKKRRGWTLQAVIGGQKIYLSTGEYEDGSLGEIFLDIHKEGAALRALLNGFAIVISKDLQHGVPLEELVETYVGMRFAPNGPVTGHPKVRWASSIPDLIFRVLGIEYLGREDLATSGPPAPDASANGTG